MTGPKVSVCVCAGFVALYGFRIYATCCDAARQLACMGRVDTGPQWVVHPHMFRPIDEGMPRLGLATNPALDETKYIVHGPQVERGWERFKSASADSAPCGHQSY